MLLPKRRPKFIFALSILYSVLFATILLAFPQKWSAPSTNTSFFSAPTTTRENTSNLPIRILRGASSKQVAPIAAAPVKSPTTPLPSRSNSTSTPTCSSIGVCDKIRFSDSYSTKQKADYYKAILQVLWNISQHLPQENALQETLYSLTLSDGTWDRRGRWWNQTILINTQDIGSLQEFREILTHELGHIIDLGVIKWTAVEQDIGFTLGGKAQFSKDDPSLQFYRLSRTDTQTRNAKATYTDFVWWYAMTSPYEDFAESFNMFLWHHDVFAAMARSSDVIQKKFSYINALTKWFYFEADSAGLARFIQNPKQRPWDTTRMSLE
jgi:hypothetical protein